MKETEFKYMNGNDNTKSIHFNNITQAEIAYQLKRIADRVDEGSF